MNEKIDQMEKKYLFMKMNLEFLFVIIIKNIVVLYNEENNKDNIK